MQPASDRPPSSNALRRYGPLALIVVLLVGVGVAVAVSSGGDDDDSTTSDTTAVVDDEVGAPEPTGRMPVTYEEADEAGTLEDYEWGDRCDPDTGSLRVPSVYASPCVPVFDDADNGGATAGGVTADTIRIVRYVPEQSADLVALIAGIGATDTPEELSQTAHDYYTIAQAQSELYGRTIELVDYQATGAGDDVVAAKADATQIATELEPFAVTGGPGLDRGTFAQELTSNGIVCIDCAGALPNDMLDAMEPYVWSGLPGTDQFLMTLGAWTGKFPEGEAPAGEGEESAAKAVYAGSEEMRELPRKVGVIHFDQDPPLFEVPDDEVPEGVAVIDSYVLDFATLPQKATELVAKFKNDDITTIFFLGDPIMPSYLMAASTEQDYFPEWIFTGTALTDTNILARGWDDQQMTHAFGISQLAAPTTKDLQEAIRVYRWYFGADASPPAQNQYALMAAAANFVVRGVQMAGPELTAETFARGQFRVPPRGGGPTTPQISFGNWGFFENTDYNGIDDSTEIWWDPSVEAEDETGTTGQGVWRRAHGGLRFINEDDAPTPAPFIDPDDTVTVLDALPSEDTPPDYPPPPGSPAAG